MTAAVLLVSGYFGSVLAIDFAYGAGCVPYWFWSLPFTKLYYEPLYAIGRNWPGTVEPIGRTMEGSKVAGRRFRRWTS